LLIFTYKLYTRLFNKKNLRKSRIALTIMLFGWSIFISASLAAATVIVAGSTTVLPLAEAAAEEFNAAHREIGVSFTCGGSGVA
jgi:ABC-type phosphate transport system substrate-binding protein